jgi:hypothetical protein
MIVIIDDVIEWQSYVCCENLMCPGELLLSNKFFVCLHGGEVYNSFVCGNTT